VGEVLFDGFTGFEDDVGRFDVRGRQGLERCMRVKGF
jgi:hypothetical protein